MLLICAGCGYQACSSCGSNNGELTTITIPLIRGDENGDLRTSLAKKVAHTPGLAYSSKTDTRYRLDVKILEDASETIGFAWDEDPITGEFIKRLYPNEGRRKVKASVSLFDSVTEKAVVSPFTVEGVADFDFVNPTALKNIEFENVQGNKQTVLPFSLGQLDSEEGAKQESFRPLSDTIADQIVRALRRAPLKN